MIQQLKSSLIHTASRCSKCWIIYLQLLYLSQDNTQAVYISHFVLLLVESKANTSGPTELKLCHPIPAPASTVTFSVGIAFVGTFCVDEIPPWW